MGFFEIRALKLFAQIGIEPPDLCLLVARITGMSHWRPVVFCFCYLFVCGAGDGTQDFTHSSQVLFHLATSPAKIEYIVMNLK
jgi:hypothetical protein